jgi:hypothetical protein
MVLKRGFWPTAAEPTEREEEVASGRERAVVVAGVRLVLGVAGTFRAPVGLVVLCLAEVVRGWVEVRRAGVAETDFAVEVRSDEADGANDILLGLADIPSLLFSSPEGSTVLSESLFLWIPVEEEVEVRLGGFRTAALVVVGLARGLLKEPPMDGLLAEEDDVVVVGRVLVDSRGAADLVAGLTAG